MTILVPYQNPDRLKRLKTAGVQPTPVQYPIYRGCVFNNLFSTTGCHYTLCGLTWQQIPLIPVGVASE